MITLRGRCQERDGRIHTDATANLLTALLCFNDPWEAAGERLRVSRRPDDLNDVIAEVPPGAGTLVAVRRSQGTATPLARIRRYVMINWMASTFAARRELLRHRISAKAKRAFARAETA